MKDKNKLRQLSFQDSDIQAIMEKKMEADASLTMADTMRGIFRDLYDENERVRPLLDAYKEENTGYIETIKNMDVDINQLEAELQKKETELQFARAQRDTYKPITFFDGLSLEAVEYLQAFFDELIAEEHYPTMQLFFVDLLWRVQHAPKPNFIPNNKQLVQDEWRHQ